MEYKLSAEEIRSLKRGEIIKYDSDRDGHGRYLLVDEVNLQRGVVSGMLFLDLEHLGVNAVPLSSLEGRAEAVTKRVDPKKA